MWFLYRTFNPAFTCDSFTVHFHVWSEWMSFGSPLCDLYVADWAFNVKHPRYRLLAFPFPISSKPSHHRRIQADHKEARAASTGPQRAAAAQGQRLRGGRFHGPVELAKTCTCGVSSCRQRHKVPARPRPQQLIDTDEAWGREEV